MVKRAKIDFLLFWVAQEAFFASLKKSQSEMPPIWGRDGINQFLAEYTQGLTDEVQHCKTNGYGLV